MKKKDKIFILSEFLLPLGGNNLIFWYFIRQSAAIAKPKFDVFVKIID